MTAELFAEDERDELTEYLAQTVAPDLALAVHKGDAGRVAELLTPMSHQELYGLAIVLSKAWPIPPTPLTRAEDGIFDEIRVARVASGESLSLTRTERDAVIHLLCRRGVPMQQIAEQLGVSRSLVGKVSLKTPPEQMELLIGVTSHG